MYCYAKTPPSAHAVIDENSCILFVPEESVDAYKSANYWNKFSSIQALSGKTYKEIDGMRYKIYEDTKEAMLLLNHYEGDIVVPDSIVLEEGTFTVTALDDRCFKDCDKLTNVKLNKHIKYIQEECFSGCAQLKSIEISESAVHLGTDVFKDCAMLDNIVLPQEIDTIPQNCFSGCTALKHIDMSSGIKVIEDHAFYGCTKLDSIVLSSGISAIPNNCFESCSALKYVDIPSEVESIGDNAFRGCTTLDSIDLPKSLTRIGEYAFSGMSIRELVVPSEVKSIGSFCFSECDNLVKAVLPDRIDSIPEGLFYGCSSLYDVKIPNFTRYVGKKTFYDCGRIYRLIFPETLETIENDCLWRCGELTELFFYSKTPPTIANIGSDGYILGGVNRSCILYIPQGTESDYQKKWVGLNIWEMQHEDFEENGIKYRVYKEFKRAYVEPNNYSGDIVIPETVNLNDTTYRVTTIDHRAFYGCDGLTSIEMPSVTTVCIDAFSGCSSLKKLVFNTYIELRSRAFKNCTSLETVEINEELMAGEECFMNCTSLRKIVLPQYIIEIADKSFYGCSSLDSVICYATVPPYTNNLPRNYSTKLYVPEESIDSYRNAEVWKLYTYIFPIRDAEFDIEIDGLKYHISQTNNAARLIANGYTGNINIPSSVSFDGYSYSVTGIAKQCFMDCSGLTGVNLPNSIVTIGDSCFTGCGSLASILIPSSVKSIGTDCFEGCSNIKSVKAEAITPPAVKSLGINECTLYVPFDSYKNYATADGWKEFDTILAYDQREEFNDTIEGMGYHFVYTKKEASLTSNSLTGRVVVPEEVSAYGCIYNVTEIEDVAFRDCGTVSYIEIPSSVTTVGSRFLKNCTGLDTVVCKNINPPFATTIGAPSTCVLSVPLKGYNYYTSAQGWDSFETIIAYDQPEEMEFSVRGFKFNIYVKTNEAKLLSNGYSGSIVIPEHFDAYGREYRVTSLGDYAFVDCGNLSSVKIPSSVTSIGNRCFANCSSLPNITIPATVTAVGEECFYGCLSLEYIICEAENPPVANVIGADVEECRLYVPDDCVEVYKSANGWKDFFGIYSISLFTGINSNHIDSRHSSKIYDLNGRRLYEMKRGINIIKGKKVIKK